MVLKNPGSAKFQIWRLVAKSPEKVVIFSWNGCEKSFIHRVH